MKLHHIRHFIAVAEAGSLHRAAGILGAAQSALSRSLKELEAQLHTRLLDRTRQGSRLTPAGHRFLVRARLIEEQLQRAVDEAEQFGATGRGTITLGMSTAAQVRALGHVLPRFRRRWPNVTISLHEGLCEHFQPLLVEGTMDFFIGSAPQRVLDPALRVEVLARLRRIVLGREARCRVGDVLSLADLVGEPWVVARASGVGAANHEESFERAGLVPPRAAAVATTMLSVALLVEGMGGFAIVPEAWGERVCNPISGLGQVPVREDLGALEMCLVTRTAIPLTPAARDLLDLLREAAGRDAAA